LFYFFIINNHAICQSNSVVGLKIGKCYSRFDVNQGTIITDEFYNKYDHKGINFNAFYGFQFNKFLGTSANIGYSQRGVIVKRSHGVIGYDEYSLDYYDFSLAINIFPVKFLSINAGLNYNYLKRAVDYFDGYKRHWDSREFYKKYDFGYNLGLDVIIKNILLGCSYFHSFTPIRKSDFKVIDPNIKETTYKNESLVISIGYQIDLSKLNFKRKDSKG